MFSSEPKQAESVKSPEGDVFQKIMSEAETVTINPEHRNAKGELLTEDGMAVSHLQNELYWKIVRTPSFKQWFGNSVVRDENGEPKIVYRSSIAKNFNISNGVTFKSNAQSWQENHFGTFFTSNRKKSIDFFKERYRDNIGWHYNPKYDGTISEYETKRKAEIAEFLEVNEEQVKTWAAFIRLEHPYVERGLGGGTPSIGDFKVRLNQNVEAFLEELRSNHDGLYLPHSSDYGDEYAVIKSENIFILSSDINEGAKEKERIEVHKDYYSPVLRPKKNFFSDTLNDVLIRAKRVIGFKNRPN